MGLLLALAFANGCGSDTQAADSASAVPADTTVAPGSSASTPDPSSTGAPTPNTATPGGTMPVTPANTPPTNTPSSPTAPSEPSSSVPTDPVVPEPPTTDPSTPSPTPTEATQPEPAVAPVDPTDPTTPTEPATPAPETPVTATTCSFDISAELSPAISTLGIVTFTTDLGTVDGGHIEFGPTTDYGTLAPIDVEAADYRTLLLGMIGDTDYHFRIVAESGGQECTSDDQQLMTGSVPSSVPQPTLSPASADGIAPGFMVTSELNLGGGGGGGMSGGFVVIFDKAGHPVWWFDSSISASRARMSWDGKFIYARDPDPGGSGNGKVVRIAIDGSSEEPISVPNGHHDLSVTPDNGVLFLTNDDSTGCGRITKMSADGSFTPIFEVAAGLGDRYSGNGNDPCHCNSVHYNKSDQTITFSCLNQNAYFKITESGELLWVLGGNANQSDFTGDGAIWTREHGHQMVAEDRILFFNNNGSGGGQGGGSLAVEVELDFSTMTATRVWTYDGGNSSGTFGDVQRLNNGNTLVTYSNAGVVHEVNADAEVLQEWTFDGGIGYVEYRTSLYGPPENP